MHSPLQSSFGKVLLARGMTQSAPIRLRSLMQYATSYGKRSMDVPPLRGWAAGLATFTTAAVLRSTGSVP